MPLQVAARLRFGQRDARLPRVARSGSHRSRCSGRANRAGISVASEWDPRIPTTPIQAFGVTSKTTEYETASIAMPQPLLWHQHPEQTHRLHFVDDLFRIAAAGSHSRATGLMLLRAKSRIQIAERRLLFRRSKSIKP